MYTWYWYHSFFFFSSRRRHTRLQGDWSSDVCSSDLLLGDVALGPLVGTPDEIDGERPAVHGRSPSPCGPWFAAGTRPLLPRGPAAGPTRWSLRSSTATWWPERTTHLR